MIPNISREMWACESILQTQASVCYLSKQVNFLLSSRQPITLP